jgi:hypothetical protein
MSLSFQIQFKDKFGDHFAFKRGNTPEEALSALRKAHDGRGVVTYSVPVALNPQPFTEESRKSRADFWLKHGAAPGL